MTAYESIKNKLDTIGVYSIEQDGLINAETKAYAAGLQPLYDEAEELLKEGFIQTAESSGLEQLEFMTRSYLSGGSLEERRSRLIKRLSISPGEAGLQRLIMQAESMGLECSITEDVTMSKLYLDVTTEVSDDEKAFLQAELLRFKPLHLLMYVTFSGESV